MLNRRAAIALAVVLPAAGLVPLAAAAPAVAATSVLAPVDRPDPAGTVVYPAKPSTAAVTHRVLAAYGTRRLVMQPLPTTGATGSHELAVQEGSAAPRPLGVVVSSAPFVRTAGPRVLVNQQVVDLSDMTTRPVPTGSWILVGPAPDGVVTRLGSVFTWRHDDGTTTQLSGPAATAFGASAVRADGLAIYLGTGDPASSGLWWLPADGSPGHLVQAAAGVTSVALSTQDVGWVQSVGGTTSLRRIATTATDADTPQVWTVEAGTAAPVLTDSSTAWRLAGYSAGPLRVATAMAADPVVTAKDAGGTALAVSSVATDGTTLLATDELPITHPELDTVAASGTATPVVDLQPSVWTTTRLQDDGADLFVDRPGTYTDVVHVADGALVAHERGLLSAGRWTTSFDNTNGHSYVSVQPTSSNSVTGLLEDLEYSRPIAFAGNALATPTRAWLGLSGAGTALPSGVRSAATNGRVIWASTQAGGLWRVDASGARRMWADGCSAGQDCSATLFASGDDLLARLYTGTSVVLRPDATVRSSVPTTRVGAFADGLVAWVTSDGSVMVYDVRGSGPAVTVASAAPGSPLSLDDGRLTWVARDGSLRRAPLASVVRASHVDVLDDAAPGFSPNGDHLTDLWSPSWRTEAPLASAALTITTAGGSTVRTLPVTVVGSVATVTWDGTTASGALAADGAYSWRLSGTSVGGSKVGRAGADDVTGTVNLSRWRPRVTLKAPATSLTTSERPYVRAAWAVASGKPSWVPETYEVQQWDGGVWVPWFTGTRGHSAAWTKRLYRDDLTLRVRLRSLGGMVSPWVTTTTQLLTDDRTLARSGSFGSGWRPVTQYGAFDSTARTTRTGSFYTYESGVRRVRVYATTCRTCGKAEVSVNGSWWGQHYVEVNTYSSTTRHKMLVAEVLVPSIQSVTVSVHPRPTSGRPNLYLDAFAFWH
ncbi:hypothetical protein GCM10027446_09880 [Angustibacter peucedani]